jgi:hypothetical protein
MGLAQRATTRTAFAAAAMTLLLAAGAAMILARAAAASQLIDRNAHGVSLLVNDRGEALLTYTSAGERKHVLAWGAINARPPLRRQAQVAFKLDYAGGYGKYHDPHYWKRFDGVCLAYDGPPLAWEVTACQAPDGSYWAVQQWQRELPDYGIDPTAAQTVWELRLSHWSGALAKLSISTDWAYRTYDHLFGTYAYDGVPIHGFGSTSSGDPTDSYGRNLYLDTFDSAYGPGWHRDNSFLTHRPTGSFCYGLYPHGSHPSGQGSKYRATAEGPGVTPDISWQSPAPGTYNQTADLTANRQQAHLQDAACKPN